MTAISPTTDEPQSGALLAVSVETLAYIVVLTSAALFRLISLGAAPLSEFEAQQALAARHLFIPTSPSVGVIHSTVLFAGTVIGFWLMGFSNFAARLIPVLAGIGLVAIPIMFRERIGRLPALITTVLLAISPVAVGTSRQVSRFSIAMLGIVIAIAFFDRYWQFGRQRALIGAGIALGIALAADYAVLLTLLAMVLGAAFAIFTDEEGEVNASDFSSRLRQIPWDTLLLALVGTFALTATAFFIAPQGLGAAANEFGRFLQGLVSRPSVVTWVGLSLLLYEHGLLVFGLIGVWLASQSSRPWQRFLAGWAFATLLLILIYPGALPGHALWVVVPMALLAAMNIANLFTIEDEGPHWAVWAHAAGVVAFFGMIFASLSQYLQSPRLVPISLVGSAAQAPNIPVDLILVFMWVILIGVLWLTVASMWGPATAWRGVGIGLVAVMLVVSIGQSGSVAIARAADPYEPLNTAPAQPGLTLMLKTIDDLGDLSVGNSVDPKITVQADPNGAMAWALRNFENITFVEKADPTVESDIVITPADSVDPALGSAYVGQDFVIVRRWIPHDLTLTEFLKWVLYRVGSPTSTTVDEKAILWVREDLYKLIPAGGSEAAPNN